MTRPNPSENTGPSGDPKTTLRTGPAEAWESQLHALGGFIRSQRQMANLSLRRLAELAEVSNPYLSQLERGLHEPSVRVLNQVAKALRMPVEDFFERMGENGDGNQTGAESPDETTDHTTESAIQRDRQLSDEQKMALLAVYRSYVDANTRTTPTGSAKRAAPRRSTSTGSRR